MEKNDGYILLFRCMMENEFLFEPDHKYTKAEMWMDMLTMARWQNEPCSFKKRGNIVTIKRGEFAKSESSLAEKWGWSKPSIIKILKEFENEGMITISRSNKINVIGIVNYEKYQNFATKWNLPQKEQSQYSETNKNSIDILPQVLPQVLPQNLPQNLPHLKESINKEEINNTSSSLTREENFFSELGKTDTEFFTLVCMRLSIDSVLYKDLLQDFIQECKMRDKWHLSMQDAKNHFVDWSRKELERRSKPKQQNNGVQAKYDPTGSYEPKSTREDYFL